MSKWTYNEHEDDTWYYGFYESREEAIAAGREEAKEFGWGKLFVGEVAEIPIGYSIDADDVIDRIAEHIESNHGGDWDADEVFLENVTDEDSKYLQKFLDDALEKWINERNISSRVFNLESVECIELVKNEMS